MHRFLAFFFAVFLLFYSFSQDNHPDKFILPEAYIRADQLFASAEKLPLRKDYNDATEILERQMNREALDLFAKVLPVLEKQAGDSLLYQCCFKMGLLEQYFDSLDAARDSYRKALSACTRNRSVADSFYFQPNLFLGSIYYSKNDFDSALLYYKKAESVSNSYTVPLKESQRLYNRLGAMLYETGNYRQAKNYFEKALELVSPSDPFGKEFSVNYQVNIGSSLIKLEDYTAALYIFRNLLKAGINVNEILNNTGVIYLYLGKPDTALQYFRQVKYDNARIIQLLNQKGRAWKDMHQIDSALSCYQLALKENASWNKTNKNVQHGITYRSIAELLEEQKKYTDALRMYQQAVIQFATHFNETDSLKNPVNYSGAFSYINLFNTLTEKAGVLRKLFEQEKNLLWLESSLDAYKSAFRLAGYVEKTYNSDEARLFLNKIKYGVHNKAIEICLELYNQTKRRDYLEDLYYFDQQNKASLLALNLQENEIRKSTTGKENLFSLENAIKTKITRLTLKATQVNDSSALDAINTSLLDNEIALNKVQEEISNDPAYRTKRNIDNIPDLRTLQKKLDHQTALLSYHLSENELVILFISAGQSGLYQAPIDQAFLDQIELLKSALQNTNPDIRYSGSHAAMQLYQVLVAPCKQKLKQIKRLIIIPDDELNYLPFEALQDENREYLVNHFSITYQYSTALLGKPYHGNISGETLAMAPFASVNRANTSDRDLSLLPASGEEIRNLKGMILVNQQAVKSGFLQNAGHFPVIHLATHANVNNEDPGQSFISFYPDSSGNKLFAREIYNLRLDSVQLVILSACETGTGQLVRGEGLMSLSRAFAYAGCRNIVTSLWKAEDRATAFLTRKLHDYIEKKFSIDEALQLAKLDLLKSNEIDPRLKSPNYWAHLIFIGEYKSGKKQSNWRLIAAGIMAMLLGYYFFKKKKPATRAGQTKQ